MGIVTKVYFDSEREAESFVEGIHFVGRPEYHVLSLKRKTGERGLEDRRIFEIWEVMVEEAFLPPSKNEGDG